MSTGAYIKIAGNTINKLDIENEIINTYSPYDSNLAIFNANTSNANILLYNNNKRNLLSLASSNDVFNIISNNNNLISLSSNNSIFYSRNNNFVNNVNFNTINVNSNITVNAYNNIDYFNIKLKSNNSDIIKANNSNILLLKGNLGIGTYLPQKTVDISGDIKVNNVFTNQIINDTNYINLNDSFDGKRSITLNADVVNIPTELVVPTFKLTTVNVENSISKYSYSTNSYSSNIYSTQLYLDNNTIASRTNINGNILNILNSNILPLGTNNANNNIINIYSYTSNNTINLGLQPTLILDKYGQMIFGSNNNNIARGIIDINYTSNYPSCNILYANTNFNNLSNNLIIDKYGNVGINTINPLHSIHIVNNSNINYKSLIGLYSSNLSSSYLTISSNSVTVANLSSKGNLTLGNILQTDDYNINVQSSIRSPTIYTDNINTVLNSNINYNNNSLSNINSIYLNSNLNVSSNIVSSNLSVNTINTTSITATNFTTEYINIENLTINDKIFNVSSSNNFITTASNVLFTPYTTIDGLNIPVSNQKVLITPITGYEDAQFIGLNISSASRTVTSSLRVSSIKQSIYETYLYSITTSLLSYCQMGLVNDNLMLANNQNAEYPFYLIYGNTPVANGYGIHTLKITNNYTQFYNYLKITNNNTTGNYIINISTAGNKTQLGINLGDINNVPQNNLSLHTVGSIGFANAYGTFPTFYYSGNPLNDWVGIGYTNSSINVSGIYKFLVNGKSLFSDTLYAQTNLGIGNGVYPPLATLHVNGTTMLMGGNVGIGTNIAQRTLDVNGDINLSGKIFINGVQSNGSQFYNSPYAGYTNDIYYLPLNAVGNIGIGTTNTSYRLNVNGPVNFNNNLIVAGTVNAGNIASTSDIRVKENIEIIHGAVDKLKLLSGYYYNRKDLPNNPRECGCIAQEVIKVLPEVVYKNNDQMGISYGNMSALFIEAFKDINKRLEIIEKYLNIN